MTQAKVVQMRFAGLLILLLVLPLLTSVSVRPVLASSTLVVTTNTKLNADFAGSIILAADNIILNCGGHAVIGSGSGVGISVAGVSGVTIKNCRVTGFDIGIALSSSNGDVLRGNMANNNNFVGILLISSSNNLLRGNAVTNDGIGFGGAGFQLLSSSNNNVISANSANGNSEGFYLASSTGNLLRSNTANNNVFSGFVLFSFSGNRLARNAACGSGFADLWIQDAASTNNRFVNNAFCTTFGP